MSDYDKEIIGQVACLEKECFDDYWSIENIESTLSYEYNKLFVEFGDDGLSGYLIANIIGDESELLRIGVKKTCRRQGIAERLMSVYLETTGDQCSRYLLEVRSHNDGAKCLYEAMGYNVIAKRNAYYSNPTDDALIYELIK